MPMVFETKKKPPVCPAVESCELFSYPSAQRNIRGAGCTANAVTDFCSKGIFSVLLECLSEAEVLAWR